MITVDQALRDKALLGTALGDLAPWSVWRAVLRASFGLSLLDDELALFHSVAGDRAPPSNRVRELWAVVGRRGGKSRMAAALAVFVACFTKHKLAPGEVGHVLVLVASRDQARVVFLYVLGFLEASPVLRQEIDNITQTEIRLKSGIVLGTHANSFKTIRGRTLLAVIFDEISSWRDELSATPDVEVYRAALPSLMTTQGMLIAISTPYRKTGLLYTKHRDHFGVDGDDVLVVQGPSTSFNPTLSAESIEAAVADDPEGARAEWEATFRIGIDAFLPDDVIDAAIDHDRPLEIAPASGFQFRAFCDPSGGRHDAMTICIGHRSKTKGGSFIADVIRAIRPPFDPKHATAEFATLLKQYRINKVVGDRYSAEWVVSAFKENGIGYEASEKSKSDLYLEALPLFTRGIVSIPNLPPLIRELRLLERQTHRGGKDNVDHPKRGSDDLANALCGCAAMTMGQPSGQDFLRGIMGDNWKAEAKQLDWMHRMYGNRYPC
jgi:hypothetical protein